MINSLKELGANLRVLYVEDDTRLNAETKKILDKIFGRAIASSTAKRRGSAS